MRAPALCVMLAVALLGEAGGSHVCARADLGAGLADCTALSLSCTMMPDAGKSEAAGCAMTQQELSELFQGPLCSSNALTALDLRGHTLGANATAALAAGLASCTALESLDVSDTRLGDAGLATLLSALPASLNRLILAHNGLTDESARAIRKALGEKNTGSLKPLQIRVLDLSWNALSSSGARALGALLASADCVVESLYLDWNGLRDRGVKEIGEGLKSNTHLKRLSLTFNGIKDSGVTGLSAGLRQNAVLEVLNLSNNGISPAADRKWRAALANKPPTTSSAASEKTGGTSDTPREQQGRTTSSADSVEDDVDVDEISFDED